MLGFVSSHPEEAALANSNPHLLWWGKTRCDEYPWNIFDNKQHIASLLLISEENLFPYLRSLKILPFLLNYLEICKYENLALYF